MPFLSKFSFMGSLLTETATPGTYCDEDMLVKVTLHAPSPGFLVEVFPESRDDLGGFAFGAYDEEGPPGSFFTSLEEAEAYVSEQVLVFQEKAKKSLVAWHYRTNPPSYNELKGTTPNDVRYP